jgi:hypothetical protein
MLTEIMKKNETGECTFSVLQVLRSLYIMEQTFQISFVRTQLQAFGFPLCI